VQQVGGSFGAAALTMALVRGSSSQGTAATAFNHAFWWAFGFTVLALIPAVLLPGRAAVRKSETALSRP
jgi:hypothetical protein